MKGKYFVLAAAVSHSCSAHSVSLCPISPPRGEREDEGRSSVCVRGAGGEDHPDARSVAEREPWQSGPAHGRRRRRRTMRRLLLPALNHTNTTAHVDAPTPNCHPPTVSRPELVLRLPPIRSAKTVDRPL